MAIVMPRARSSGALSMESKARNSASPLSASTLVIAAVKVVLPWSIWPIVPTFTWGLVRSNFFLAIQILLGATRHLGAHDQDRTGDLILTKNVLYRLSYVGGRRNERF